jgi:diguanylate cyclase (GGDEF)-like protein
MDEFSAIAQLTRQADFRSLCRTTLEAVQVMLPNNAIEILEAFDPRGTTSPNSPAPQGVRRMTDGQDIVAPEWLKAAMLMERHHEQLPVINTADEQNIVCLGVLSGMYRFLAIAGNPLPEKLAGVVRVATIFAHLLTLMDRFERDPLTDLLNRQSFDYRFEELMARHRRDPQRTRIDHGPWLAIADIDDFKRVNDSYGHVYGDEILQQFADLLRESFRTEDLLFRYGGEEFVIILNNTDPAGAAFALERFREKVSSYAFPTVGRVTVSVGWVPIESQSLASDLIHRADQALYKAKQAGRNRVLSYAEAFGETSVLSNTAA